MSKPLMRLQPRSSVAGILESGVAAQALSRQVERATSILPTPISDQVQALTIQRTPNLEVQEFEIIPRQFTLSGNSDQILKRIVSVYSDATGLDLKHSELLRSILVAAEHALPELTREARLIGRLKRPKNDKGTKLLREEMEKRIAKAFVAGMRAAGTLN